jgi:FixJ family two-component response regulator
MTQHPPIVYLVDDDPSVLRALTRLLSAEGFDTRPFDSPQRFLAKHDPTLPGCIVLDVAMPNVSGLDLQDLILKAGQIRPIIFISGNSDIETSVAAMKKGAVDFLTKPFSDRSLLKAVKEAIRKDQADRIVSNEVNVLNSRFSRLTSRERQVLKQVALGKLNKQIAANLGIVEKTVKVHRARMMKKMGASTLAELIHFAERLEAANIEIDRSP